MPATTTTITMPATAISAAAAILPLANRRVAITRAHSQNPELRAKLETLGATVLELPLITIIPDVDKTALVEIFAELGSYDWIVFTSANGVRIFFEQFHKAYEDIRSLGLLRFACVGRATAREIENLRLKVECIPDTADAESLADALIATGSLDNAKVIVVTGNLNRDILMTKLTEARAIVDRLPLYRTEKTDLTADPVARDFRENGADAILFASSSAAESYAAQRPALQLAPGAKNPLHGSIGPRTSETLHAKKLPVDFEAKTASLDALADALVARLTAAKSKA